jgi:hypothetical protein
VVSTSTVLPEAVRAGRASVGATLDSIHTPSRPGILMGAGQLGGPLSLGPTNAVGTSGNGVPPQNNVCMPSTTGQRSGTNTCTPWTLTSRIPGGIATDDSEGRVVGAGPPVSLVGDWPHAAATRTIIATRPNVRRRTIAV